MQHHAVGQIRFRRGKESSRRAASSHRDCHKRDERHIRHGRAPHSQPDRHAVLLEGAQGRLVQAAYARFEPYVNIRMSWVWITPGTLRSVSTRPSPVRTVPLNRPATCTKPSPGRSETFHRSR